jgi:hypothetical protein
VLTFGITPLWSWFERTTTIESIGHSGPAAWCYVAVYLLLLAIAMAGWIWQRTRRHRTDDERSNLGQ